MNWLEIIARDGFSCIYCGGDDRPLYVRTVNKETETTSSNSATVCRLCKMTKVKQMLGKPGWRVFEGMIRRLNESKGFVQDEPVLPATENELVAIGNMLPKLPQRDYLPYDVCIDSNQAFMDYENLKTLGMVE